MATLILPTNVTLPQGAPASGRYVGSQPSPLANARGPGNAGRAGPHQKAGGIPDQAGQVGPTGLRIQVEWDRGLRPPHVPSVGPAPTHGDR